MMPKSINKVLNNKALNKPMDTLTNEPVAYYENDC